MRGRLFSNKIHCYVFKIGLIYYIHSNESLRIFRILNNFNQTLVTQPLMSMSF